MMQPQEQETGQDSLTPPSEEGYAITILVLPTGFSVSKESLPANPDPQSGEPLIENSTDMLKAVLRIVQANPSIDQASDDMAQGFNSR